MPISIIISVIALLILVVYDLFLASFTFKMEPKFMISFFGTLLVGILILWGLVTRKRLAWQWGRVIGLVAGILSTIGAIASISQMVIANSGNTAHVLATITLSIHSVCLVVITSMLGRNSAKEFFGLICPVLRSIQRYSCGFLFQTVQV